MTGAAWIEWLQWLVEAMAAAYWLPPLVAAVFFGLLARIGIYPTRRMMAVAAVPFTVLLVTSFFSLWWALVLDVVFLGVLLIDWMRMGRFAGLRIEREIPRVASIRQRHSATLHLIWTGRSPLNVELRDDVPNEMTAHPETASLTLQPLRRTSLTYEFRPESRGAYQWRCVHGRFRSPLGMWQRFFRVPAESTVHVYPDMKQLSEYALLARTNRLSLIGVRRTRRTGQDNEFEQLRDYTLDDNYKFIDWRATARRNKLTVRDYQVNQSQRLMFLLDCGRMMVNEAEGLSLLDHALNALLMLGYVALAQGDSVGMLCFSDRIHSYVPPRSGANQMNRLLHASFDRFPELVESRYDEAFLHLATHCRKRTLVILVTNVIDEVNAEQIRQYLQAAAGRHLTIGVLLRDRRLFDPLEKEPASGYELYRQAAAAQIAGWRHQVLTDLWHQGVRAMDLFPEQMTAPLINEYLEVKARHLL